MVTHSSTELINRLVEPRYNKPLYNKVVSVRNNILQPGLFKMYGAEPQYNKPLL